MSIFKNNFKIVACVCILIVILTAAGIGIYKSKSMSDNLFRDQETVRIECFGDSITEGYQAAQEGSRIAKTTYPIELEKKLLELLECDEQANQFQTLEVINYGQAGSILQKNSASRLSGSADIVIILYTANNFVYGTDYVDTLETNIETIRKQGSQVFLMNYPIAEESRNADKLVQANNYIASVSESLDVLLIDLESYFTTLTQYGTEELFGADLVHLTDLGYTLTGDYVAEYIYHYYCNTH